MSKTLKQKPGQPVSNPPEPTLATPDQTARWLGAGGLFVCAWPRRSLARPPTPGRLSNTRRFASEHPRMAKLTTRGDPATAPRL